MTGCTYNAQGCLVCPALPAIPGAPGYVQYSTDLGWNAGANSIAQLDGDVHTVYGMPLTNMGAMVGFKYVRDKPSIPQLMNYGLYFFASGVSTFVQVSELGNLIDSTLATCSGGDTFEVRRASGVVTYWQNSTLLYTSTTRSGGPLIVNGCLYASGDTVGT